MTPTRLLDIGPGVNERLQAALFTSFDAPDPTLLTDQLLPALLDLPPTPDRSDRNGFARAQAALCRALRPLRGRVVIVSSSRGEWDSHWLTSYLRLRRTGADSGVVQHAKLWMLHWKNDKGRERLELVVSSANLTSNGINDQIQAAWRASVRLGARSAANYRSWNPLSAFLDRLGASCGQDEELRQFNALLERAACPGDVRFVATAPAAGTWGTDSLAAALGDLHPSHVRILTPFTGSWQRERLADWLARSGCAGARVELIAPAIANRVPESTQWILDERTRADLFSTIDFGLLDEAASCALRNGISSEEDRRWTHAKLYEFRSGRRKALLVTSANFTPAAWNHAGKGNFELGILLRGQALPITCAHAHTMDEVAVRGETQLRGQTAWAEAEWDGRVIVVRVRTGSGGSVQGNPSARHTRPLPFPANPAGLATVHLPHSVPVPRSVTIALAKDCFTIPVIDVREDPESLPIGELDEEEGRAWEYRLLLEKFGIPVDEEGGERSHRKRTPTGSSDVADYGVSILEDARTWFACVDNWAHAYAKEATAQLAREGEQLLRYFENQSGSDGATGHAAQAVVDELRVRLNGGHTT